MCAKPRVGFIRKRSRFHHGRTAQGRHVRPAASNRAGAVWARPTVADRGLRLTLVLPSFALFLAFISWSVATSTEVPAWWTNGIEPTLGVGLDWALVAIQFTMVLTFALMLLVHRVRLGLSVHGIESEVAELGGQHRWVASSHGYDHIEDVMHRAVRATTSPSFCWCSRLCCS